MRTELLHNIPIDYLIACIAVFIIFGVIKRSISNANTYQYSLKQKAKEPKWTGELEEISTKALKDRYVMLHGGLSQFEAERALERHIALLRKKHPGQRLNWYIDRAIYELKKDRRAHF